MQYQNVEEWFKIKKRLKGAVVLAVILLPIALMTGCNEESSVSSTKAKPDINIKELVHYYSTEDTSNDSATITSEHLNVKTEDNNEESYDLPQDEFFVSIAPYINYTHP